MQKSVYVTAGLTKETGLIRYDFYQKWGRATLHILGDILEWSSYTLVFVDKKDRIAYGIGSSILLLFPGSNGLSYEFARAKLVNAAELHHKSHISLWIRVNSCLLHYSIIQNCYNIVFSYSLLQKTYDGRSFSLQLQKITHKVLCTNHPKGSTVLYSTWELIYVTFCLRFFVWIHTRYL